MKIPKKHSPDLPNKTQSPNLKKNPTRLQAASHKATHDALTKHTSDSTSVASAALSLDGPSATRSRDHLAAHDHPTSPKPATLPALPTELSFHVLDQAALSPLQLLALMQVDEKAPDIHSLQYVAALNTSWATFTPFALHTADAIEGAFAQSFLARYNKMTPTHRRLLDALWSNRLRGGKALSALRAMRPSVTGNFDIMRAAVQTYGPSFKWASSKLRADPVLVMAAVTQFGWALEYAAPALQANFAIALQAVRETGQALVHVAPILKAHPAMVMAAVSEDGQALAYADPSLQADVHTVLAAVRQDGTALQYAHPVLQANLEVVKAAVSENPAALAYADSSLRESPDVRRLLGL